MSRPLRIEYPGAWYHIMNRGRRGENIFTGENDFETFVSLLQEAGELWQVRVSAFCLMGNHYHALIQTPLGNLSRFMRHLNGVYTQRYNRAHKYDGQLFRGRYKSILVEEDSYLLELLRYIHRNPLRAGIADTLAAYPWSSHYGYLSSSEKWQWLYKDFILSMLADNGSNRKAYCEFVREEDSLEICSLFEKKKWPSVLGTDNFISWVKTIFFETKKDLQVPESFRLAPGRKEIRREVCHFFGVEDQSLLRSCRGKNNEPRDIAIYLCRVLRNDTLRELGQEFNMTGYSPASSAVERVRNRLSKNKPLHDTIWQIKKKIFNNIGQSET